jgi:hypothetical protein
MAIALLIINHFFCSLFANTTADYVTVPFTLDHNRIIIRAAMQRRDGSIRMIKAWVDNGNPAMTITERLVKDLGLITSVDSSGTITVTGNIPEKIQIEGKEILLKDLIQPIEVTKATSVGAGLDADINIPSTVLKNYDVVIDYPAKKFTLGYPGSVHFHGNPVRGFFNPINFLIQIPAGLDSDEFNLALDIGTPVSFISRDLISKWSKAHSEWPYMYGAIGVANLWGTEDKPGWELLRIKHILYGGIEFSNLVAVSCPQTWLDYFIKRAAVSTAGLIGAEALLDYRIGIDYVHRTVYFQRLGNSGIEEMDLVGLILRPEADRRFSILGVADFKGKPSVTGALKGDFLVKVNNNKVNGLTMGGVWSLLHGRPGTIYTLELDRAGKHFTVKTKVHRFLSN